MDSTAATTALAAVACASMFEGTAFYLSFGDPVPYYAEKLAGPPTKEMLRDWRRMYPPAKSLQSKLVALGAVASAVTAWGLRDSDGRAAAAFGAAAACNVAIFGYTLAQLIPLNNRLLPEGEVEAVESDESIAGMLRQWGKMHGVRTLLGGVALGATLYGTHALLTNK